MHRPLVLGCCLLIAACAADPAAGAGSAARTPRSPVITPDMQHVVGVPTALALVRNSDVAAAALQPTPEELWTRLVEVFNELDLPVTALSTESRLIGTQQQRMRRIGGQPVDRYFECPGTAYGNTASTEPVAVTVVAQLLRGTGGGTELHLATQGLIRPRSNPEMRCRSTDRLERVIRDALASVAPAGS